MKRRIIGVALALATGLGLTLAGPSGTAWANAAHDSSTAAMPGGAGTISCTTDYDYDYFNGNRTARPVKTYCTNNTNRYITWPKIDFSATHVGLLEGKPNVIMNPGGVYTYYWPAGMVDLPLNQYPYVLSFFTWKTYTLRLYNELS